MKIVIWHFLSKDLTLDEFLRGNYEEEGDFVNSGYKKQLKEEKEGPSLSMEREGRVADSTLLLSKEVSINARSESFKVLYSLKNTGDSDINVVFAPEFNLTMPFGDSERYSLLAGKSKKAYKLDESITEEGIKEVKILDEESDLIFRIALDKEADLWHFPVKTVSLSETAYELNYQASSVIPRVPALLKKDEVLNLSLEVSVSS